MRLRKMFIWIPVAGGIVLLNLVLWLAVFGSAESPAEHMPARASSDSSPALEKCTSQEESPPAGTTPQVQYTEPSPPENSSVVTDEDAKKLSREELKELTRTGIVIEDHRPKRKPVRKNKEVKVIVGNEPPLPEDENPPADIKLEGK